MGPKRCFDDEVPRLENALFVQPHPDDCVLSVYSLLTRCAGSRVATVFAGVPDEEAAVQPGDLLTGVSSPRARMLERRAEDLAALSRFDVGVEHLGFVELAHRREKDESGLIDEIVDAIAPLAVGRECIVAPLGIGGNPNHVQVSVAARVVSAACAVPVLWYADYPYAAWFSWPHWVRGSEPDPLLQPEALWHEHLERAGVTGSALVVELTEGAQRGKLEAFAEYRSQVRVIERGDLRAVSHPEHVRFEVLYTG